MSFDEPKETFMEIDEEMLKKKNIKKMYVDKKGIHCFILAENELFYNNFYNPRVFLVNTGT